MVHVAGAGTTVTFDEALAGSRGSVSTRFRYEWRNVNYGLLADMSTAVLEASIQLDNRRACVWEAGFLIDLDEVPSGFDPTSDFVAIQVETLVNGAFVRVPWGLFKLDFSTEEDQPTRPTNPRDRRTVRATGLDPVTELIRTRLPEPFTAVAGLTFKAVQEFVADLAGVQHNFPELGWFVGGTPGEIGADEVSFGWAPTLNTWHTVMSDLMFAINEFPPYSNAQGVVVTRERINPALEIPAVTYQTTNEPRMFVGALERPRDTAQPPNTIVVVQADPFRNPFWMKATNIDPQSAISTANEDEDPLQLNGDLVPQVGLAGEIAIYEVQSAALGADKLVIHTALDPRRGPHEFYRIFWETEEVGSVWRVDSWSASLSAGALMTHRLSRVRDIQVLLEGSTIFV